MKRTMWILSNAAIALFAYMAITGNVGAERVVWAYCALTLLFAAFATAMLLLCAILRVDVPLEPIKRSVPARLNATVDIAIAFALIYFGLVWLGCVFLIKWCAFEVFIAATDRKLEDQQ